MTAKLPIPAAHPAVSVESDGWALLRQDHTELFDKEGKQAGSFHQTMVIYSDGGQVHADYVDGEGHAIHYVSADITPGRSVIFIQRAGAGAGLSPPL